MAALIENIRLLDDAALALLASTIGNTLEAYEAYAPFDKANIYAVARLDFGRFSLDLVNRHEPLAVGPQSEEELVAVLAADISGSSPLWRPPGKDTVRVAVGTPIDDVLVVIDTMLLSKGSRSVNKTQIVQAIVFEAHGEDGALPALLAFDRDIWSDEYLNVRSGDKISAVTRDHRPDWVAEPPYSYKFRRDIVRLSQKH